MFEGRRGTWIAAAATALVLAAGGWGAGAAQDADDPGLDVDALAERLALDEEGRAELSSLEELLRRRAALREEMTQLRAGMHAAMSGLRQRLTAENRQELGKALRESGLMHRGGSGATGRAMGHGAGRARGGHMRDGRHAGMRQHMQDGRHMPGMRPMRDGGATAPDGRGARLRMHEPGTNPDCPYAPGPEAEAPDGGGDAGAR